MQRDEITKYPKFVAKVLHELIVENATQSVWFIGSRANGCERPDSDWDFIVFVTDSIYECCARHPKVDIIRVDKNEKYLLEGQKMYLSGPFKIWNWRKIKAGEALYTVRKTPDVEKGQVYNGEDVRYIDCKGIRIWKRNA
jgi:predicted nucleotidyltransferase